MSKNMIEALVKSQYNGLNAKDNKERLGYMVAGIKDGKFYDHTSNTDYGVFDANAEDAVFIPESDLELSRITGAKIATVTVAMQKWFDTYTGNGNGAEVPAEESEVADEEIDTEAVEKARKKAIKKGDLDKAQKLIDKLGGHKKLQKKLDKAK